MLRQVFVCVSSLHEGFLLLLLLFRCWLCHVHVLFFQRLTVLSDTMCVAVCSPHSVAKVQPGWTSGVLWYARIVQPSELLWFRAQLFQSMCQPHHWREENQTLLQLKHCFCQTSWIEGDHAHSCCNTESLCVESMNWARMKLLHLNYYTLYHAQTSIHPFSSVLLSRCHWMLHTDHSICSHKNIECLLKKNPDNSNKVLFKWPETWCSYFYPKSGTTASLYVLYLLQYLCHDHTTLQCIYICVYP